MKFFRLLLLSAIAAFSGSLLCAGERFNPESLPREVFVNGGQFHVQGIAWDRDRNCMYMSFTSAFFKTDMEGNVIASVSGINGHLGAMTFDPVERKVYASLELKDDSIGQGISKGLNAHFYTREQCVFYIASIDVDKITSMDMRQEDVMTLTRVDVACEDYQAKVKCGGKELEHRFACSGIDGVTIGPEFGKKHGRRCLYVAYGVYGDNSRSDNDYNVLLCYDLRNLAKPLKRYFIFCGNTTWGVQNLGYDGFTGKLFMAVYSGKKEQYPNYSLFAVDMSQKPFKAVLKGVEYHTARELQLKLDESALVDEATGISGWNFKWGSTGFCPIGDGWYYISENGKTKDAAGNRNNYCRATLYRWNGDAQNGPFVKP